MKVDRRAFLKKAGFGSLAVASLATFVDTLAVPSYAADDERVFVFVANSKAKTVGGVDHRAAFTGSGKFNAGTSTVEGGGTYIHWNNAPKGTPKPLLSFGTWKATKFMSYSHQVGKYGTIRPSIVELQVDLIPQSGPKITGATLRLICNVGPAGLMTGEPEGYKLTIPGAPYGTFVPLDPISGITHIGLPWA